MPPQSPQFGSPSGHTQGALRQGAIVQLDIRQLIHIGDQGDGCDGYTHFYLYAPQDPLNWRVVWMHADGDCGVSAHGLAGMVCEMKGMVNVTDWYEWVSDFTSGTGITCINKPLDEGD